MVGTILSHYKITEKLGEGGMGSVYKAEDLKLHRQVAVKIFPSVATASPEDRNRFFQEARLASSLNHPNIVTIYEFDESHGTAFIVSEYIEGRTLRAFLQEKLPSTDQVLDVAIQIASGVAEAHVHDIVHRDLKPENVMVSVQGQVKVTDFGLARLLGSSHVTSPGSLIGTFAYMSPEQINEEEIDVRSDIFSFGIMLYQMATGQLPFRGKTIAELLASIARKRPESITKLRSEISPELERIIFKAMEKNPEHRYQTVEEMKQDIIRLHEHPTMKAQYRGYQAIRHHLPLAILLTVIVAAFSGLFLWNMWKPTASPHPIKSIAVLPFANDRHDVGINYFSLGFANDIITRLSFVRSLVVKPTSAISQYQGKKVSIKDIGKELNADCVLEGRYYKQGTELFVSAQLVDAAAGNVLWADQLSVSWQQARKLQENVANKIVDALQLELTTAEYSELSKERTSSAEAYEYYLRGIGFTMKDSRENNDMAVKMFERAVSVDDQYAEAYAALSNAYIERFWSNYSSDTTWVHKGENMARRALSLDPQLAVAHAALGYAYRVMGNYHNSILEAVRAVEMNPHTSFSLEDLSEFYRNRGEFDKAVFFAEKAFASDPTFNVYRVKARILQFQNKYAESVKELQRAIMRSPQDSWLRGGLLAISYIHLGELYRAEQEIAISESIDPEKPEIHLTRAMILTVRKDYAKAQQQLDSIDTYLRTDYAMAFVAAAIYAKQNNIEQATKALRDAVNLGNRWYSWCQDGWFDAIRSSPGFQNILQQMKNELDAIDHEIAQHQQIFQ